MIHILFHAYYNIENKLSETVQDKYSFITNKSLDTPPFPTCKSLKPTTSLVLHQKQTILQIVT